MPLQSEWTAGAAQGHHRAVGVTLGTGVGSAFLADGRLCREGLGVVGLVVGLAVGLTFLGVPVSASPQLQGTTAATCSAQAHEPYYNSANDVVIAVGTLIEGDGCGPEEPYAIIVELLKYPFGDLQNSDSCAHFPAEPDCYSLTLETEWHCPFGSPDRYYTKVILQTMGAKTWDLSADVLISCPE